jgi:hypothetical protein
MKKMFIGSIILVFIAGNFGDKSGQGLVGMIIGLTGAFIIVSFVFWLVFYIKDSNTTSTIKKTVNKKTTGFMSGKPKPKDMNEVADALLKFQKLLNTGAISQQEFDDAKKDLLNRK